MSQDSRRLSTLRLHDSVFNLEPEVTKERLQEYLLVTSSSSLMIRVLSRVFRESFSSMKQDEKLAVVEQRLVATLTEAMALSDAE